jgi:hypothetical protein
MSRRSRLVSAMSPDEADPAEEAAIEFAEMSN